MIPSFLMGFRNYFQFSCFNCRNSFLGHFITLHIPTRAKKKHLFCIFRGELQFESFEFPILDKQAQIKFRKFSVISLAIYLEVGENSAFVYNINPHTKPQLTLFI